MRLMWGQYAHIFRTGTSYSYLKALNNFLGCIIKVRHWCIFIGKCLSLNTWLWLWFHTENHCFQTQATFLFIHDYCSPLLLEDTLLWLSPVNYIALFCNKILTFSQLCSFVYLLIHHLFCSFIDSLKDWNTIKMSSTLWLWFMSARHSRLSAIKPVTF